MNRTYIGLGIFVVATLGLLVWLAQFIGAIGERGGNHYEVRLDHAAGLVENNAVKIAGVSVGRIEDIAVDHDVAVLTLNVQSEIVLHDDARAIVRSKSLLGEKYLQLDPGQRESAVLEDGDSIAHVDVPFEIDEVLNALQPILGGDDSIAAALAPLAMTLNDLLNDAAGKAGNPAIVSRAEIRQMVEDSKATLAAARRVAEANEEPLRELVAASTKLASDPRIPRLLGHAESITKSLDERLPSLLEKTEATLARLDKLSGVVDEGRSKKIGKLIDDAAVTSANLRKMSDDLQGVGKSAGLLVTDLGVLAKRAKGLDEAVLREFFQKEGFKVFFGNKREAQKALAE